VFGGMIAAAVGGAWLSGAFVARAPARAPTCT
jgi:hypothetical protein